MYYFLVEKVDIITPLTTLITAIQTTPSTIIAKIQEASNPAASVTKAPKVLIPIPESVKPIPERETQPATSGNIVLLNNKNTEDEQSKGEKLPDDFVAVKASGVKQQSNPEQINKKLIEKVEKETNESSKSEIEITETPELDQISAEELSDEIPKREETEESSVIESFEVGFEFKY